MRYLTWSLLLPLLALSITACKPLPPETRMPVDQSPVLPEYHTMGYVVRWVGHVTVRPGERVSEGAILGDMVTTVQYPGNVISAVGLNDGGLRWQNKFVTPSERLYEPFRRKERDVVLVNSESTSYELTADTGRLLKKTDLPGLVSEGPGLFENLMVFGAVGNIVRALDVDSGREIWNYRMSLGVIVKPIIVGDSVFLADANGVYVLLASTGQPIFMGHAFERITAQPIYSPETGIIYVASEDKNFYALDASGGRERWIVHAGEGLTVGPSLAGNLVFLTLPQSQKVIALDARSGRELWTYKGLMTPVTAVGQTIIAHDGSSLLTLDADTGAVIRKIQTNESLSRVINGPGGSLIVIANSGQITRLDPRR